MNSNFLFPNQFKIPGLILLITGLILGTLVLFLDNPPYWLDVTTFSFWDSGLMGKATSFSFIENNILDEIAAVTLIIGALFFACSREKQEDEFISKLRLDSLLIASYVNYSLLIIATIFIHGFSFFNVIVFNMFTLLIIFIIRFQYILHKNSKSAEWAID